MPQKTSKYQLYFDDPRLRMSIAGRIIVRVVSYISYLVLAVATFVCLLSYDIRALFYLGIFLLPRGRRPFNAPWRRGYADF